MNGRAGAEPGTRVPSSELSEISSNLSLLLLLSLRHLPLPGGTLLFFKCPLPLWKLGH